MPNMENSADISRKSEYLQSWRLGIVITSLFIGAFLIALDVNIINVPIPNISTEFNSLPDVAWYDSAYLLTITAFQPTFVGSVVCAAAPNSKSFIVGRAIAGLGAAGMLQGALAVIGQVVELSQRSFYMGVVISVFIITVCVGPVLGGVFTQTVSWRWCFWINVPIGGFVLCILFVFLNVPGTKNHDRSLPLARKLKMLDPIGCLLFLGSIACLLLALQWAGQTKPWISATILGLFVGSATLMTLFAEKNIPTGNAIPIGQTIAISTLLELVPKMVPGISGRTVIAAGATGLPSIVKSAEELEILQSIWSKAIIRIMYLCIALTAASVPFTIGMEWKNSKEVASKEKRHEELQNNPLEPNQPSQPKRIDKFKFAKILLNAHQLAQNQSIQSDALSGLKKPNIILPNGRISHQETINIGVNQLVYNAQPGNKFKIYSDNQAGLFRLKTPSDLPGQSCQIKAIKAAEAIQNKGAEISLNWVPGHTSVQGNELADSLAKEATKIPSSSHETSYASIGMDIKRMKSENWIAILNTHNFHQPSSTYSRNYPWKISSKIRVLGNIKRSTICALFQLKIGHGYFKSYLKRFGISSNDNCRCGGKESPDHLLLSCPLYKMARKTLNKDNPTVRPTMKYLLHTKAGIIKTLEFIEATRIATRSWHLNRMHEEEEEEGGEEGGGPEDCD
ncbi:hypothetical protein SS1G_12398 [Sclerotinia sclerotiorum 1980 UF-70]|uniref:Uncharacterized protein n=1 Tax=Sclerotinia sclerotiorum (strain ATCC 18683 / 1980 / Ss-1) TaxID=665079 RepID=A7F476_SCLS1|nr:hypothetical protein SS1G_12398 [Sclerotinia sclerotiorum 1980 UF-70]EDN97547.1 hypothetical protein SS1G_12398 [Sclerotinia sclerotiorum 1980 UF-70]